MVPLWVSLSVIGAPNRFAYRQGILFEQRANKRVGAKRQPKPYQWNNSIPPRHALCHFFGIGLTWTYWDLRCFFLCVCVLEKKFQTNPIGAQRASERAKGLDLGGLKIQLQANQEVEMECNATNPDRKAKRSAAKVVGVPEPERQRLGSCLWKKMQKMDWASVQARFMGSCMPGPGRNGTKETFSDFKMIKRVMSANPSQPFICCS